MKTRTTTRGWWAVVAVVLATMSLSPSGQILEESSAAVAEAHQPMTVTPYAHFKRIDLNDVLPDHSGVNIYVRLIAIQDEVLLDSTNTAGTMHQKAAGRSGRHPRTNERQQPSLSSQKSSARLVELLAST
jgi:hypothetical protein